VHSWFCKLIARLFSFCLANSGAKELLAFCVDVQWLAAVEVALLKGRHPLLEYSVNLAVKSTNDNWHHGGGKGWSSSLRAHQLPRGKETVATPRVVNFPEVKEQPDSGMFFQELGNYQSHFWELEEQREKANPL